MGCDIYVSRGNGHIGPVPATGNFLVLRGAGPGLAQAFVLLPSLMVPAVVFNSAGYLRAWLHGEFQPGFWNKSSENQIVDYMERDSARGAIQPRLKILARSSQTGLGFSVWPNGPENLKKCHVIETEFQPAPKKELEYAHRLCFRTSVNFLTEICVLRPGWNWAYNHNNISFRWAKRYFSPSWNSSYNQAFTLRGLSWLVFWPQLLYWRSHNSCCPRSPWSPYQDFRSMVKWFISSA